MKIETFDRPGLVVLGVVGIAATALLGFAAGMAVSRDPEAVRRTARRVVGAAATGLERATLMAAQAREQLGDLWAEARDAAASDIDDADFERAAAAASKSPLAPSAEAPSVPKNKPARKRAPQARKARAPKSSSSEAASDATD